MHDRIAIAVDLLTAELKEGRLERRRHLVTKEDLLATQRRILAALTHDPSDGISPQDRALLDGLLENIAARTAKLEALDAVTPPLSVS